MKSCRVHHVSLPYVMSALCISTFPESITIILSSAVSATAIHWYSSELFTFACLSFILMLSIPSTSPAIEQIIECKSKMTVFCFAKLLISLTNQLKGKCLSIIN